MTSPFEGLVSDYDDEDSAADDEAKADGGGAGSSDDDDEEEEQGRPRRNFMADDDDEEGEPDAVGSLDDDPAGATAMIGFIEKQEAAKADEKATWDAQWAEYEAKRNSGFREPDGEFFIPPPQGDVEAAAGKAAFMDPQALADFSAELKANNEALREKFARQDRAGTDGFDSDGDALADPEPPYTGADLVGEDFQMFLSAVTAGGPAPFKHPAKYSEQEWQAKISSALGR